MEIVIEGVAIVFQQEEADENAKKWANTVAGYVIEFKPHIPTLEEHLRRMWVIKGELEITTRGTAYFFLRFSKEDDIKTAPEDRPWFVRGKPIILKKWEPGERYYQRCPYLGTFH